MQQICFAYSVRFLEERLQAAAVSIGLRTNKREGICKKVQKFPCVPVLTVSGKKCLSVSLRIRPYNDKNMLYYYMGIITEYKEKSIFVYNMKKSLKCLICTYISGCIVSVLQLPAYLSIHHASGIREGIRRIFDHLPPRQPFSDPVSWR